MDTKWYIIANPTSGGGAVQKRWPKIEALLQEFGFSYTIRFTERPGHATLLVEEAILRGHRQILGIGGDGTNHEIVNGILKQQAVPSAEIAYALLPVGTGNDWARTYQLPHDPRKRLQQLLQGKAVFQDVGWVEYHWEGQKQERYFANVAGMAYDGYIGQALAVNRSKVQSKVQYLLMVAQYLSKYILREAQIAFNGQTVKDFFYTINIGICRYSGGGMQFVPQAIPDDGQLALTFARRLPKWEVLLQTRRFYNGTILQHPKVEGYQTQSLTVDHIGEHTTLLEADGEFLGETPVRFAILPKALKVIL
jgi:YegS/Rv2252/BmrU family lipid kinase